MTKRAKDKEVVEAAGGEQNKSSKSYEEEDSDEEKEGDAKEEGVNISTQMYHKIIALMTKVVVESFDGQLLEQQEKDAQASSKVPL